MNITMGGLNHHRAGVEVRERFAPIAEYLPKALQAIRRQPGILGCVILSTCNRMEVYLSHEAGMAPDTPQLLCEALGIDAGPYRALFSVETGPAAATYLCEVAAGIQSRVLGEDQILAQVKTAIATAREAGTADGVLEALFRTAITAGKRVKTQVRFFAAGGSVAHKAVEKLAAENAGPAPSKALVVGNGTMGRLVAAELAQKGYAVAMTLRTYAHGGPALPEGCQAVPYDERYCAMEGCEVVVSATASPHHTIREAEFSALENPPRLLVDLAVPRDIEPGVANCPGVRLWNVDDLEPGGNGQNGEALQKASALIEEQLRRFMLWHQGRSGKRPVAGKNNRAVADAAAEGDGEPARQKPANAPPLAAMGEKPHFPAFINLDGQRVLVAGGGKIATRRVGVLLRFGAKVLVVAPGLTPQLGELARGGHIEWQARPFAEGDLDGALLAVAATSDRAVNKALGEAARRRGILVSVADCQAECSFYFPAIVQSESLTAGIVSNHGDHALVRKTAATLRERLDAIETEHSGGQPGQ